MPIINLTQRHRATREEPRAKTKYPKKKCSDSLNRPKQKKDPDVGQLQDSTPAHRSPAQHTGGHSRGFLAFLAFVHGFCYVVVFPKI
jgi:hypothetical protein